MSAGQVSALQDRHYLVYELGQSVGLVAMIRDPLTVGCLLSVGYQ